MKQFQKHAEGTEQIHSDYIICLLFISKFKKNKFEYFVYININLIKMRHDVMVLK